MCTPPSTSATTSMRYSPHALRKKPRIGVPSDRAESFGKKLTGGAGDDGACQSVTIIRQSMPPGLAGHGSHSMGAGMASLLPGT